MRAGTWAGALVAGAIALGPATAAQAERQTYRFTPVDAAICKKRTEKGDKSGGTTKLAPNKSHKYNAGDGDDTLIGGNRDDILNGGRGDDKVFGGGGDDVVCGGGDNDEVYGEDGRDRVFGEEDNDFLDGGEDNDKVNGQAGLDRLVGYMKVKGRVVDAGKDLLDGSFERDVLIAGGFDVLIGGAEDDELSSRTPDSDVKRMDGFIGNDTIIGSDASDGLLFGDIGDDTIRGGGGNDTIDGGGSNDQVFGGDGDDDLTGGDNEDFVSGDGGDDDCDGGPGNHDTVDQDSCERIEGAPRGL